MIRKAREDILKANGGKPPRVLDPFGGGGSIPLEALRLGCETYANDLNPVAVLIQKCTLEYPQKYGHAGPRPAASIPASTPGVRETDPTGGQRGQQNLFGAWDVEATYPANPLLADVKRWGEWVLREAQKELGRFYPPDDDGHIPVGYIWARTIPCQNPACGTAIPLMRQYWLAKKDRKKVALFPYVTEGAPGDAPADRRRVSFRIVGTGYGPMPAGFDPEKGSVARAVATCPVCGATVDAHTTRTLFQEGKAGERMVAVVLHKPGQTGKRYRIATDADMAVFHDAAAQLAKKREALRAAWGMDPVPDEPLTRVPVSFGVINVWVYGMNTWGSLFNARQQLALITFAEKVRKAYRCMLASGYSCDYSTAIISYLALILSRHSSYNATLCWWEPLGERGFNVFGRQAIPMVFDNAEQNPFGPLTGNWLSQTEITIAILGQLKFKQKAISTHASATSLPYSDNYFDAVFTDPPYYDNVPYSYLSDFFYVGQAHPG